VVEDNVVVIPVRNFNVHGARAGARWDVDVVRAEGTVPNGHVMCSDEERLARDVRAADDHFAGSGLTRNGDKRIGDSVHGSWGDDSGDAKNARARTAGAGAVAEGTSTRIVQVGHFKHLTAAAPYGGCAAAFRAWEGGERAGKDWRDDIHRGSGEFTGVGNAAGGDRVGA